MMGGFIFEIRPILYEHLAQRYSFGPNWADGEPNELLNGARPSLGGVLGGAASIVIGRGR
jgi:hypothetical protein